MGKLKLALLGRPQVTRGNTQPTGWALNKSRALLAYLAVTGHGHSRGALAGLLWPDLTETNARSNLRKVVAELRLHIPSHLAVTRADLAFDRASDYWLDVEAFERLVGRGLSLRASPSTEVGASALAEAVDLYRGEFLDGLAVHRAAPFEEWVVLEREHLRQLALQALHALADHYATRDQPERSLSVLDRLLALEPAQEDAHRRKMALLVLRGERATALHQYEACLRALRALGAEPDGETTALYEKIRSGDDPPEHLRIPVHALQVPLTSLVGREAELAEVCARLRDPDCRLLTIVGPGGVGKTHLALRLAADMQSGDRRRSGPPVCFSGGICTVRLASVPAAAAILPTIAQALDLPLAEGAGPHERLVHHLQGKRLLLVMDGFEHLLAGTGLLVDLLQDVPGLKILATSRTRLNVQAEHEVRLGGLSCPERPRDESECPASAPAIRLFLSGARRIRPDFEPSAADLQAIIRVCRLVDGLPLAILLAANWTGMLTPDEIASQLERDGGRGLGFLQTDSVDLPPRQRSMRAVCDHSWNLLAAQQRQALARLSVFRGSFTLKAARRVAGASLRELRALMDRSLLQRAAVGRYTMHELVRQYAQERLAEAPGAATAARDRHSACYSSAVQRWWTDLQGPGHQEALAEMSAEIGNLRTAWDWAVDRGLLAQLDQTMEGLCYFYKWLGRYEEGESLCQREVEGFGARGQSRRQGPTDPSSVPPPDGLADLTLARALGWQGVFCHRLGHRERACALLQQSLDLLDDLATTRADDDGRRLADIQRGQAFVLWRQGNLASDEDHEAAQRLYQQSLALYRGLQDHWGTAGVLEAVGRTAAFSAEHGRAQDAYAESLELRQALGDDLGCYRVLSLSLAAAAYDGEAEDERFEAQETTASALHQVGLAMAAGEFARAESLLAYRASTAKGSEAAASTDLLELVRALNQMHLGQYEGGGARAEACLAQFRETDYRWGIERCCFCLACAAMAAGAWSQARRWLQESIGLCREIRQQGHLGQSLALLSVVAHASGNLPQARRHLGEAVCVATPAQGYATFAFQIIVVPAMALLLASEGQHERAVELYGTASRYPLVTSSRLIQDLTGRHLAAVAAQLPPDAAAVAWTRGRERSLAEVIAAMQSELGG